MTAEQAIYPALILADSAIGDLVKGMGDLSELLSNPEIRDSINAAVCELSSAAERVKHAASLIRELSQERK